MTAVIKKLTEEWLVPYINVHYRSAGYLEHNIARRRAFQKCGWAFVNLSLIGLSSQRL